MRYFISVVLIILLYIDCFSSTPDETRLVTIRNIFTKDSVDIQLLYNGRAWRNLYHNVKGDQFLFSNDFLPGSVKIEGILFKNLMLRYDIYNDELILITDNGIIIDLNKEMVDFFSLVFNNTTFNFINVDKDSIDIVSGYVNVIYEGKTSLYVKYRKEILQLAVDNRYDLFSQSNKVYIKKDGKVFRIDTKNEFLSLFEDHKNQLHGFMKSNRIKISRKIPESFKPVLEYYDKLIQ